MSRIPIVLIAGFLGAGKTTFLRALMGALKERKVGFSVVVNDFEALPSAELVPEMKVEAA